MAPRGIGDPLLPALILQLLAAALFGAVSGRPIWESQLAFGRAALPLFPVVALVAAARAFALDNRDSRALASRERTGGLAAAAPIGLLLLALVAVPQVIRGISGERRAPVAALARPTFHASVEPILQASCQTCHRPGGIAPFSLLSYEDAETHARAIRRMVASRQMPPWKASEDCEEFANDPSLSEREIATIVRWVDAGAPEGDPKDAPPARAFADGWELGTPDLVLDAPEFVPDFSKGDLYQCFVLPTNLDANAWISAVEVKPGNRAMVHHALLYVEEGSSRGTSRSRPCRARATRASAARGLPSRTPSENGPPGCSRGSIRTASPGSFPESRASSCRSTTARSSGASSRTAPRSASTSRRSR